MNKVISIYCCSYVYNYLY